LMIACVNLHLSFLNGSTILLDIQQVSLVLIQQSVKSLLAYFSMRVATFGNQEVEKLNKGICKECLSVLLN